MKRILYGLRIVGIAASLVVLGGVLGYWCGLRQGLGSSGMNYGVCRALRAKALLGVLESKDDALLSKHLNHDLDYGVVEAFSAQKWLEEGRFPWQGREEHGPAMEKAYRLLAEFRRQHPTDAKEEEVVKAMKQLLEKY